MPCAVCSVVLIVNGEVPWAVTTGVKNDLTLFVGMVK